MSMGMFYRYILFYIHVSMITSVESFIKIGCWNVQGLFSKDVDKTKEDMFIRELENFDVIGLVETHVVEGQSRISSINGYETKYFNRAKHRKATQGSGGIAILLKPELKKGLKFFPSKNNDYVWAKLDKNFFHTQNDIYLCVAYVPPSNSTYTMRLEENILDRIETDVYKFKTKGEVIIMGDLNGRTGVLPDFIENDSDSHLPLSEDYNIDHNLKPRTSQDRHIDDRGKHILEICIAAQLRILNGRKLGDTLGYFTSHNYNGSAVVDYVICSSALLNRIPYFKIHRFNGTISDHCMVSFALNAKVPQTNIPEVKLFDLPRQFQWNENSPENFQAALQLPPITTAIQEIELEISKSPDPETITSAVEKLNATLVKAAELSLKRKQARKNQKQRKPWMNDKIRQLEREVHRKGLKMIKYKTGEARKNFFLTLKVLRKERKYARRHFVNEQVNKLTTLKDNNPRQFWKIIQDLKEGDKENHADLIQPGVWYNHLAKNNIKTSTDNEDRVLEDYINKSEGKHFNELDFKFKREELIDAIKKTKNNKSPGLDCISNEMIKHGSEQLHLCILSLFNKIYTVGEYPDCWSTGYVTNIHKKGSHLDPYNYRGITIMSSLGKLFNSVLTTRLQKFLDSNNIISKEQIGFTKDASTADHIFTLKTMIQKYTKGNAKLYTCFIDFRQAFDKVWHSGLFYKLSKLNINNHFLRIVQNMYSKIKLRVKVHNKLTEEFKSTVGVRQGDNLSPILFNLYINDLPSHLSKLNADPVTIGPSKLNCLLYADDVILLSTTKSGLQKCIDAIKSYSEQWKLEINLNKTKTLTFNKSGSFIDENFYLGQDKIESVNSYTYLGLDLDSSGTFENAISKLSEKGLKALFKLYRLTDFNYNLPTMIHIFDHTIAPILLYGAEVWGINLAKLRKKGANNNFFEKNLEGNPLTQLELKFCRRLLHVKRNTPLIGVRGELGRYPITIKAITRSIKYLNQIEKRAQGKLIKDAMQECIALENNGQTTWFSELHRFSQTLDIPIISPNNSKDQLKTFIRKTEKKLENKYDIFWHQQLNLSTSKVKNRGGNKLRTYNKIKQHFEFESYLGNIENTSHRKAVTQLRLSAHTLRIESQRGLIPDPKNRTCQQCNLNMMEDEIHFLTECPFYNQLRTQLDAKLTHIYAYKDLSNENKLIWLLSNEDKEICKLVGKFVYDCFDLRKTNSVL